MNGLSTTQPSLQTTNSGAPPMMNYGQPSQHIPSAHNHKNFNRNANHYSHNMHQFNGGMPNGLHNLTSQDVSKVLENSTKRRPSSYNDFQRPNHTQKMPNTNPQTIVSPGPSGAFVNGVNGQGVGISQNLHGSGHL